MIWEPRPASYALVNLEAFLEAIEMVDVFSPSR